jgi:hypothetical protein
VTDARGLYGALEYAIASPAVALSSINLAVQQVASGTDLMFLRSFRKFTKHFNRLVKRVVGVAGFEPATPTSRTWCATRLRYTPTEGRSYNPGVLKRKLERGDDRRARNTDFEG